MSTARSQFHLGAYLMLPTSHFTGMWKHPLTVPDFLDKRVFENLARTLEAGFFDFAFSTDSLGIPTLFQGSNRETLRSGGQAAQHLDGTTVMAVMAAATQHLGLGTTIATTFTQPYHIARALGTLDQLSGGRAAWNIVTGAQTPSVTANFGNVATAPRDERYDYADEVVEATEELLLSWEADALVIDRERELYADPDKVHAIDYEGTYIQVRGPLSVPRSPQGRPVFMQAGGSDRGMEFAARWAEAVFVIKHTAEEMIEARTEIRRRAELIGRDPDGIKVLPAVLPVVAETSAIAAAKVEFLHTLIDIDAALALLSAHTALDLSQRDLDAVFDPEGGRGGLFDTIARKARTQKLTLREFALEFATSEISPLISGTPAEVAEQLIDLHAQGASDGFIITPASFPTGFEDFARFVVPELQRRGAFRTRYEGTTLRDHLGLAKVEAAGPRRGSRA